MQNHTEHAHEVGPHLLVLEELNDDVPKVLKRKANTRIDQSRLAGDGEEGT